MTDEKVGPEKAAAIEPFSTRALEFAQRAWRPAGSGVAVCLALLLMTHVINGRNGLTVWHKKRAEDQARRSCANEKLTFEWTKCQKIPNLV